MYDLTQMGLDQATPEAPVAGDQEYRLRIVAVKCDVNKNGGDYWLPRFEVVNEPTAREFTHYIGLPTEGMDAKELNRTRNRVADFLKAFDITIGRDVNPEEEWVGKEGWAIVGLRESTFHDDGQENFIRRFIAPR